MEIDIYVAVQEIGIGGEVDAQLEEEDERVGGMNATVFIVLCPVDKTCALTSFRVASVSPMPEHDTIIPRVIQV